MNTKRPWHVAPLFVENQPTALAVFGPREPGHFNGKLIATVRDADCAPLIAAAPAMLAALREARAILRGERTHGSQAAQVDAALAVIDSAEGRQS